MKVEINWFVELVQVLLFLSDRQDKTSQCLNNQAYVNSIYEWFVFYKNHNAVILTRNLIDNRSFYHIKPLRAILSLESLFSDTDKDLQSWSLAVKDFAQVTCFDAFFESQREYYQWILDHIRSCNLDAWVTFIEKYFRDKPDEFNLIICPFAGNYGFSLYNKCKRSMYTVRAMPYYDEQGEPDWRFDYFAKGVAHEYAHCFVNPIVEANKNKLAQHKAFFKMHTNIPRSYNTDYAVINEYFVRAFQIRFMELNKMFFPNFNIAAEYELQKRNFVFLDRFLDALKEFECGDRSFSEFYNAYLSSVLTTEYK